MPLPFMPVPVPLQRTLRYVVAWYCVYVCDV